MVVTEGDQPAKGAPAGPRFEGLRSKPLAPRLPIVVVTVLIVTVLLPSLTCAFIRTVNPPRKTYRFIFPEGARGEFVLRCLVAGAPPLPWEDGFRLVRFEPGTRTLETQDEYVFGNEYFREEHFVAGAAGRKPITVDCIPSPSMQGERVDATCRLP